MWPYTLGQGGKAGGDLVNLDPEFIRHIVMLAEPSVEAGGARERPDFGWIDLDGRHQQTR